MWVENIITQEQWERGHMFSRGESNLDLIGYNDEACYVKSEPIAAEKSSSVLLVSLEL